MCVCVVSFLVEYHTDTPLLVEYHPDIQKVVMYHYENPLTVKYFVGIMTLYTECLYIA